MSLPDFIGIGSLKAGSSLLYTLMEEHPDIAMARHRKEVMFFDRHHHRGPAWYEALFEGTPGKVHGEFSPSYLYEPECAARIHALVPDARLIAVIRDPVSRARSQFTFFVKEHGYAGRFADFLDEHPNAIERGLYMAQLERYLALFPREQLLVVLFEDLVADPVAVAQQAYAFVGADPSYMPARAGEKVNASQIPRFHRLYRVGRQMIGWLYRNDLAWVVAATKRTGLKRVFLPPGRKSRFDAMDDASRDRLQQASRADALALGDWLGRDLGEVWPWLRSA